MKESQTTLGKLTRGLGLGLLILGSLFFGSVEFAKAQAQRSGRDGGVKLASRELWLFFSPSQAGLRDEIRRVAKFVGQHRDIFLRPCLLVEDWSLIKTPRKHFADTIKELRTLTGPRFSLRIWDDEGLAFARSLGIDRLPAYALLGRPNRSGVRRAHVAYGAGGNLKELLSCSDCR